MKLHFDLSWILLGIVAGVYFFGGLSFEPAVILMLLVGLPYGGPA